MTLGKQTRTNVLAGALALVAIAAPAWPQASSGAAPTAPPAASERDGQHDFDFIFGTWKAHLKRLDHPLTGSHTWLDYDGVFTARSLMGGKANLDEAVLDGPAGHLEGITLRLYNPETHLWYLYWAAGQKGTLEIPVVGQFKDGRGLFYDTEVWHGKAILVRYDWSGITPSSAHFEQSFSVDGGATWEVNWISDQVRMK